MKQKLDYAARARRVALSHPRFTFISIQVNFWILAYLFLSLILYLSSRAFASGLEVAIKIPFFPSVVLSVFSGIVFGSASGAIDLLLEKSVFRGRSLGLTIVVQVFSYFAIIVLIMMMLRFVFWESILVPYVFGGVSPIRDDMMWRYFSNLLLSYTFVMTIVISFVNQMNRQFGPGILIPLMMGKYRKPKEERRIFMFMDLKSSTSHAERLGHLTYSAMIRDCFLDINRVLSKHHAEIYQYVGDEIVLSWSLTEGLHKLTCIRFFFGCQSQLRQRRNYYMKMYGFVPEFKAGVHVGVVTAVEVGEVKRNIAYHGDAINTAARIQSVCNKYNKEILVSGDLASLADFQNGFRLESLGGVLLKGKDAATEIFSVEEIEGLA